MHDAHGRPKYRPDEHDDVPRAPFGEHQRSVQPDDNDDHGNKEPNLGHPALLMEEVVRQMKRHEEN